MSEKRKGNQLAEMAFEKGREVEFADRVFGTYHPETIEKRREELELAIASLVHAETPVGAAIGFTETVIKHTIEDGFEDLLDTVRGSNHPMIQQIRENL